MDDPPIEYIAYPRPAFYSKKFDKIFINPLIKKYDELFNYVKTHETNHFKYAKKPFVVSFFLNIGLEWKDALVLTFNRKILQQYKEFNKESYDKYSFTIDEIKSFENIFLDPKYSHEWFIQKIYESLRPDSYMGVVIIFCILYFGINYSYIYLLKFLPDYAINLIPYILSLIILLDLYREKKEKSFKVI